MNRFVRFQLGPPNSPKLTLDEWEALAKSLEAWFPGASLQSDVSGDPTNYGATSSSRELLSFNVPTDITHDGALGVLSRELAGVGRTDLIPQLD